MNIALFHRNTDIRQLMTIDKDLTTVVNLYVHVLDHLGAIKKKLALSPETGYNTDDISLSGSSTVEVRIRREEDKEWELGYYYFQIFLLTTNGDFTDAVQIGSNADPVFKLVPDYVNTDDNPVIICKLNYVPEDAGIPDAPADNKLYGRKNEAWSEAPAVITTHNDLTGRDAADAHPEAAITGLEDDLNAIDTKFDQIDTALSSMVAVSMQLGSDIANQNYYPVTPDTWQFVIKSQSSNTNVVSADPGTDIITLHKKDVRYMWSTTMTVKTHGSPDKTITHQLKRASDDSDFGPARSVLIDGGTNKVNTVSLDTAYIDNTEDDLELYAVISATDNEVEILDITVDLRVDGVDTLTKVTIGGEWNSAYVPYKENTIVTEDGWLMYTLQETYDHAAPQFVGDSFDVFAGTMTDNTTSSALDYLAVGQRYSFQKAYYAYKYRFYAVGTTGYNYRIVTINKTDPANPIITTSAIFTVDSSGWHDVNINPILIRKDAVFDIFLLIKDENVAPVETTLNYSYSTPVNGTDPGSGVINHANRELDTLRVSTIDYNGNDQSSYFATLSPGDYIQGPSIKWEILSITANANNYYFEVTPQVQEADGIADFTFGHYQPATVDYGEDADYWLNASYTNVKGLYQENGFNAPTENNTAYPIDIHVQEVIASPDWGFLAFTQGVGGGTPANVQSELKDPFTETIDITTLLSHSLTYTQTGILNIVKGNVNFIGGTYQVLIVTNGDGINFSPDFYVMNNDYEELQIGLYLLLFALLPDGKIGVTISDTGADISNPTIQSATVENATPSQLDVVFDKPVNITDITGLSLNFTTGTAKTLTGTVTGDGTNTLSFAISADIEAGDVFTFEVASNNNIKDLSKNPLIATSIDVSNNLSNSELLAEYLFNNDVSDSSGNGRDGVINGTVTYVSDRNGNTESAVQIDTSSGDYVKLGNFGDFDLGTNGLTYAFWAKTSIENVGTIIDYGSETDYLFIGASPNNSETVALSRVGFGSVPMIDTGVNMLNNSIFVVVEITGDKKCTIWVDDMTNPTNEYIDISAAIINGQAYMGYSTSSNNPIIDNLYIYEGILTETERINLKAND